MATINISIIKNVSIIRTIIGINTAIVTIRNIMYAIIYITMTWLFATSTYHQQTTKTNIIITISIAPKQFWAQFISPIGLSFYRPFWAQFPRSQVCLN